MRRCVWVVVLGIILLGSCGRKGPSVLSEHKMENVLYDYHLYKSMAKMEGADSVRERQYFEAMLTKHGISEEEFDTSMVYYMVHADRMRGMYEHLSNRFTNEGRLQGLEGNNLATGMTFEGDTANIWNLPQVEVFTEYVPSNLMKFSIAADTTFMDGDKFTLSFDAEFLTQDNVRNGFCAFMVHFKNDSVVTRSRQLSSNTFVSFDVEDKKRVGVDKLTGYFMLRPSKAKKGEENSAPLRLMILSGVRLIRMHTEVPEDFVKPTTITNDSNETIKPTLTPDTLVHEL